ncbi:hypothetical protein Afil01_36250 [Actinorhabdospora filicis]|uniref:YCII-related domain-containing protein n=1 Tax=Actinorhabdospora filicis TaxID=1785913 RepID=A0A9W6WAA2_9ACTN|nr:hypothetical protein Afil01_36250 [Actinorhabdospora filicis]
MKYLLMIYAADQTWAEADEATREQAYAAHEAFGRMLAERGAMIGGEELAPAASATTVRATPGGFVLTDGPYAETAEQLGGYYLVEAAGLDEALDYAKALPAHIVEVRPIAG